MADDEQMTVADVAERERYEAELDGELAGYVTYRRVPGHTVLLHTKVEGRFEGRGVGSALARAALDGERARGQQIEPQCPFVASFIRRHPEYEDLVPDDYRALLNR